MKPTFEEVVKSELKKQDKSIIWLAEKLGVTRDTVYKTLRNNPELSTIKKIGKALGMDYVKIYIKK